MIRRMQRFIVVLAVIATASPAMTSELGDRLGRRLKGGWGVLEVEVYSACGGTYSDNEVGAAGVASKAPNRFAEGYAFEVISLARTKKGKKHRKKAGKMIFKDFSFALIGLIISVALAAAANPSIRVAILEAVGLR